MPLHHRANGKMCAFRPERLAGELGVDGWRDCLESLRRLSAAMERVTEA